MEAVTFQVPNQENQMIEYPHSQFSFCFIFLLLSLHFPNNQMQNISKKNEKYDVIITICRRIWKHKHKYIKTKTKTKEEHLESDIVIGLIREQKRTRDLLFQFDWREKKTNKKTQNENRNKYRKHEKTKSTKRKQIETQRALRKFY